MNIGFLHSGDTSCLPSPLRARCGIRRRGSGKIRCVPVTSPRKLFSETLNPIGVFLKKVEPPRKNILRFGGFGLCAPGEALETWRSVRLFRSRKVRHDPLIFRRSAWRKTDISFESLKQTAEKGSIDAFIYRDESCYLCCVHIMRRSEKSTRIESNFG